MPFCTFIPFSFISVFSVLSVLSVLVFSVLAVLSVLSALSAFSVLYRTRSTSANPNTVSDITPFMVKNAASRRERSPGFTSWCS
jgi:hypothetical protein